VYFLRGLCHMTAGHLENAARYGGFGVAFIAVLYRFLMDALAIQQGS
jgi:hypothetical protein